MEKTSLKAIAGWAGGSIDADTDADVYIKEAVIDSRDAEEGSLFFCIRGERTDGHNFVGQVREKGGYSIGEEKYCDIIVDSVINALGDIAREYLKTINPAIVAVTGSNGKTTTTRIISRVLKEDFNVKSTLRSFNNNIGLPVSVLNMDKETRIGILEMGASHSGEIKHLCGIAKPEIGVITNAGEAHIGYFGSRLDILNAKFEIARSLPEEGTLIYNYDQDEVRDTAVKYGDRLNLIGFGLNRGAEVRGKILSQDSSSSIFEVDGCRFKINIPGNFNVYNSIAAIATVRIFHLDFEKISFRLKEIKPFSHRMEIIRIKGMDILDDCYNANPTSVRNLFSELLKIYPQKDIIAVIGEMLDLGDYSCELHQAIGEFISSRDNVKCILAGGNFSDYLIEGAKKGNIDIKNMYKFKDACGAAEIIKDVVDENSVVVLKASRLAHLEDIIEYLKKNAK